MTGASFQIQKVVAMLLAGICVCLTSARANELVDLQLVLAVDVSSSVNYEEYDLQMRGYVAAFRSAEVKDAIRSGAVGRIRVAMMQWAGSDQQALSVNWTEIGSDAEAEAFADRLEYVPRAFDFGGTAITPALRFAVDLLARDGHRGTRQVIDVSGDGRVTLGAEPDKIRDQIVASGITINGLPILNEEPTLNRYYEAHVIGGYGAFVEIAADFTNFAQAIRQKLAREIRGVFYGS